MCVPTIGAYVSIIKFFVPGGEGEVQQEELVVASSEDY